MTDYTVSGLSLRFPVRGRPLISQFFGVNAEIYGPYGLAGHEGLDFALPIGSVVVAAAAGQVWRAGDSKGPWGIRVILQHEFGFTVYAHLRNVMVSVGRKVEAEQVLGYSGDTGNVTGPHLHFSLALRREHVGYACPAAMGAAWWYDPMLVSDASLASRRALISEACCQPATITDV